MLKGKDTVI